MKVPALSLKAAYVAAVAVLAGLVLFGALAIQKTKQFLSQSAASSAGALAQNHNAAPSCENIETSSPASTVLFLGCGGLF